MSDAYSAEGDDWASAENFNTPAAPKPAVKSPWEGRTATNPKTGQKLIVQGGQWVSMPTDGAPPPANAAQAKLRVLTADQPVAGDEMNRLMSQTDPGTGHPTRPNLLANGLNEIPIVGSALANMARTGQQQTLNTAGQQWITSAAHALSGARIGDEQLHQLLIAYLPAATDKPDNVAFKAAQRRRLEEGIANASGLTGGTMSPEAADALVKVLMTAPKAEQERPAAAPYIQQAQTAPNDAGPRPLSPQEAAALPPNTVFIGLDGVKRVHH